MGSEESHLLDSNITRVEDLCKKYKVPFSNAKAAKCGEKCSVISTKGDFTKVRFDDRSQFWFPSASIKELKQQSKRGRDRDNFSGSSSSNSKSYTSRDEETSSARVTRRSDYDGGAAARRQRYSPAARSYSQQPKNPRRFTRGTRYQQPAQDSGRNARDEYRRPLPVSANTSPVHRAASPPTHNRSRSYNFGTTPPNVDRRGAPLQGARVKKAEPVWMMVPQADKTRGRSGPEPWRSARHETSMSPPAPLIRSAPNSPPHGDERRGRWSRHTQTPANRPRSPTGIGIPSPETVQQGKGRSPSPMLLRRPDKTLAESGRGRQYTSHSQYFSLRDNNGRIKSRYLVGLENLGNTCYINAALQCLLNIKSVMEATETHFHSRKRTSLNTLSVAFLNLARRYIIAGSRPARHTTPLDVRNAFVDLYEEFGGFCEHDTTDFLSYMLAEIGQIPTGNKRHATLDSLFRIYSTISRRPCKARPDDGNLVSKDESLLLTLPVAIQHRKGRRTREIHLPDIESALAYESTYSTQHSEITIDGKKYDSFEQSSLIIADKTPPYLIVHLKKFGVERGTVKVETDIDIPHKLDLSTYTDNPKIPNEYTLIGAICHLGRSAASGHYYALLRPYEENFWFKASDLSVTETKSIRSETKNIYACFYRKK